MEKNNQLKQIFIILNIEVEEKTLEKEWSLKNILIRLFTYPFSISLIVFSIWNLTINENEIRNIVLSFIGIGICVSYLYADIKLILKNYK